MSRKLRVVSGKPLTPCDTLHVKLLRIGKVVLNDGSEKWRCRKDGSSIQSIFFDMWRQDHPEADLHEVPSDLVTTSGSGLDPHITLQNAEYQLDRVASKWSANLKRDPNVVRKEIEQILEKNASAPWFGLAGEKFINVLEVNLELRKQYGTP